MKYKEWLTAGEAAERYKKLRKNKSGSEAALRKAIAVLSKKQGYPFLLEGTQITRHLCECYRTGNVKYYRWEAIDKVAQASAPVGKTNQAA